MALTRRAFLMHMPIVLSTILLACKTKRAAPTLSILPPEEAITLDALLDRLIPAGNGPSARDANVIGYFEQELKKPIFAEVARSIKRGLIALTEASKRDHQRSFVDLPPAHQDAMIESFASNTLAFGKIDTAPIFLHIRTLAFEGYLGDPSYGGNKAGSVWAWAGISPHMHTHP